MKIKEFSKYKKRLEKVLTTFSAYTLNVIKGEKHYVDEKNIDWFSSKKGYKAYENFEREYQSELLSNINNIDFLRGYLLLIYVEGLYSHLFKMKGLQEMYRSPNCRRCLIDKKFEKDTMFIRLSNHIHSVNLTILNIQEYLLTKAKYKLPIIDKEGFNISGAYFDEFELDNTNEVKREALKKKKTKKVDSSLEQLKSIWLGEPKISVEDFLNEGFEKGLWDEEYNVISKKGGLYSTGVTFLGSLAIALKGWAIHKDIDHKKVGEIFCNFFNISIKQATKDPYKLFSTGKLNTIKEFKRTFKIR